MGLLDAYKKKLKQDLRVIAEERVVAVRANLIDRIADTAIAMSPVFSGTYVNAHTIAINDIPIRVPVVYIAPISEQQSKDEKGKIKDIAFGYLMKTKAESGFNRHELMIAKKTPMKDKISIVMQINPVYWAASYVEPTYHIYEGLLTVKQFIGMYIPEHDDFDF